MSDFLNRMKSAVKADLKTIVLPEGEDPRTIVAATKIIEEGLAKIVILGQPRRDQRSRRYRHRPAQCREHEEYAHDLSELEKSKGVTTNKRSLPWIRAVLRKHDG